MQTLPVCTKLVLRSDAIFLILLKDTLSKYPKELNCFRANLPVRVHAGVFVADSKTSAYYLPPFPFFSLGWSKCMLFIHQSVFCMTAHEGNYSLY